MAKQYSSPEIKDKLTNCEPVETGCCLRSCGGSPHHVDGQSQLDAATEKRLEEETK